MKLRILIPTFLAFAISVAAQTGPDKITPQEYREANNLARLFWARLLDTKDFKPLLGEFFVDDFIERHRQNEEGFSRDFLRPEEMKFVTVEEQKKLFTVGNTWMFLGFLYINGAAPPECEDDDELLTCFPEDVQRILKEDSALARSLLNGSLFPRLPGPITREGTLEYFSKTMRIVNKLMSSYGNMRCDKRPVAIAAGAPLCRSSQSMSITTSLQ